MQVNRSRRPIQVTDSALRSDLVASTASERLMAATTTSAWRGAMLASSSSRMVEWV